MKSTDDVTPDDVMHKSAVHNKEIQFHCSDCGHIAKYFDFHQQHTHEAYKLVWDECKYKFKLQSPLRKHKRSGHKQENYACYNCVYITTREAKLVIHMQFEHGAFKHSCDQCEPWFFSLGIHMNHREFLHEVSLRWLLSLTNLYGTLG